MRTQEEKQASYKRGEVYEEKYKDYYRINIKNPTFKIISPKNVLKDFWSPSFDRREGDLWITFLTPGNLKILRRVDIKHNFISLASIREFGRDEDHFYGMWNDSGKLSYNISAIVVYQLLEEFEKDEKCPWIESMPSGEGVGINLTNYDNRYHIKNKIMLDQDIENINDRLHN